MPLIPWWTQKFVYNLEFSQWSSEISMKFPWGSTPWGSQWREHKIHSRNYGLIAFFCLKSKLFSVVFWKALQKNLNKLTRVKKAQKKKQLQKSKASKQRCEKLWSLWTGRLTVVKIQNWRHETTYSVLNLLLVIAAGRNWKFVCETQSMGNVTNQCTEKWKFNSNSELTVLLKGGETNQLKFIYI